MAHTSDRLVMTDNTKLKIATGTRGKGRPGKSQTINLFDRTNREGHYQQVYRIKQRAMYVTPNLVGQNASNLHALDSYLLSRGAIKEGPRP